MRPQMSAKQTKPKRRIGRPATGKTKVKPSITMDMKIEKLARKAAFSEGVSLSAWIERAVRENLAAINGKAGV